jgi:signal transduction histidine kinase
MLYFLVLFAIALGILSVLAYTNVERILQQDIRARRDLVIYTYTTRAQAGHKDLSFYQKDMELQHTLLNQEYEKTLASLQTWLWSIGLGTFIASLAGCLMLIRLGLAPLKRLSTLVGRVSSKDFRLPLDNERFPRELLPIIDRLTKTLQQLQRAFEREKHAVADMSHELRTPLAALMTTLDVALRKPRSPEEYRELLSDCHLAGRQMSQLVERLLALARLDAGVDTIRPQEIDAARFAEECADLVRPLARARDLSLEVHRDGPMPLRTDPDKLREILTNLLHNAIEYNRPAGIVDLTVRKAGARVEFEVRDTGTGISTEQCQHVFERFYRVDESRTSNSGYHAGLGLAIVKSCVDLLGGTIRLKSAEGQGTTFQVEMPSLEEAAGR